jgi:alanyl-tRNA synthetase
MRSAEIRQCFFDFFENNGHKIVPSAPIVVKSDPTLMFTNAGMNQFKDFFLGNSIPEYTRIANTQKCLRVSGKHNDLEEVGRDSYHHTMFEMLGNWSIGDYFKEEAIKWAWELLTVHYGLQPERLYATVFMGDEQDGLTADNESADLWKKYLPEDQILYCAKKDNFWEMGDTGPCGPCSELHYDLRNDQDRAKTPGRSLVNQDSPLLIEIWNLVFIQFNRKSDGTLEELPQKHVDTGMGFERLCMAMQGKLSNYDTDVFWPFIQKIEEKTGVRYTNTYDNSSMSDVAMRVIADHMRAVSFTIADGELPGNTGAGYVIRRILRRAVRYYYSFLNQKEPFVYSFIPMLADAFSGVFPELKAQESFVSKVILEEERSFLRTLEAGLRRLDSLEITDGTIAGKDAFELYDTYGFPIDLSRLIAAEKSWSIDEAGFEAALNEQKERGRAVGKRQEGDWIEVLKDTTSVFLGYHSTTLDSSSVVKYRTVQMKDKSIFQLVLDRTVFYPEGGGQVGDIGVLRGAAEEIKVLDTIKENDLIIHIVNKIPEDTSSAFCQIVDAERRKLIENNHSATHLLHAALRSVLGDHVQQKGSLVKDDYLRFDFSHFQKLTDEEIQKIEKIVNARIAEGIALREDDQLPIEKAKEAGAMMLFGEKYGETVRMITFDPAYSVELCGGCHVDNTAQIGLFKIRTETAIAAGVRRIEALTSSGALTYINAELAELETVRSLFKNSTNLEKNITDLQEENKQIRKEAEQLKAKLSSGLKDELIAKTEVVNGIKLIRANVGEMDAKTAKTLAYNVLNEMGEALIVLGLTQGDKVQVMVAITESLTKDGKLHAGQMVKQLGQYIDGGGGGQAFFATAGGKNPSGINDALKALEPLLS